MAGSFARDDGQDLIDMIMESSWSGSGARGNRDEEAIIFGFGKASTRDIEDIIPGVKLPSAPNETRRISSRHQRFNPYERAEEDEVEESHGGDPHCDEAPQEPKRYKRTSQTADSQQQRRPSGKKTKPYLQSPDDREDSKRLASQDPQLVWDRHFPIEKRRELDERLSDLLRPPISFDEYKQKHSSFDIYVLCIDYCTPSWSKNKPVLRVIGSTIEGHSAALLIENFAPYFFVRANGRLIERIREVGAQSAVGEFAEWLNGEIGSREGNRRRDIETEGGEEEAPKINAEDVADRMSLSGPAEVRPSRRGYVRRVSTEPSGKWRSVYGYKREEEVFLRIETFLPKHVPMARSVLFCQKPRQWRRGEGGNDGEEEEEEEEEPTAVEEGGAPEGMREDSSAKYGRFEVYQADVLFTLRFMIDKGVSGCGWLSVPIENVRRPPQPTPITRCQLELLAHTDFVRSQPSRTAVPPLRTASIDIECAGRPGWFPEPDKDPIISMAVDVYVLQDGKKAKKKIGFCVGSTDQVEGIEKFEYSTFEGGSPVKSVAGEKSPGEDSDEARGESTVWDVEAERQALLALAYATSRFIDPDFWCGYNTRTFDDPYLVKRADTLGIGAAFRRMGRVNDELISIRGSSFESKAYGRREDLETRIPGVISWDVLMIVRRDLKLRHYSLNFVAGEVLGKKKHDVSHDMITPYWIGRKATPATRRKIFFYNENDSRITYEINWKKCYIYQYQELARATGVPIEFILTRGQGVKSISQILRAAQSEGYLLPTFCTFDEKCSRTGFHDAAEQRRRERESKKLARASPGGASKKKAKTNADGDELEAVEGQTYEGAIVIDPILGYYSVPIITLDFSSLYPSIMITHNLCYTTWISKEDCEKYAFVERDDYVVSPAGHRFVTRKHRTGLLVKIVEALIAKRNVAKGLKGKSDKTFKAAESALKDFRPRESIASIEAAHAAFVELLVKNEGSDETSRVASAELEALKRCTEAQRSEALEHIEAIVNHYDNLTSVYESRQLALKISANSVYGFTGAFVGSLPLKAVAESVTAYGRVAIQTKLRAIEVEFPLPAKYGRPDPTTGSDTMRPVVIGGDTDSIFIIFPCESMAEAMQLGQDAAKWINEKYFVWPMQTVFEKGYKPAIYIGRKRYIGQYHSGTKGPEHVPRPDGGGTWARLDAKGIETVRRDNCLLVSETLAGLLRKILCDDDPVGAFALVQGVVEDLRTGKVDLSKLVVSKSLSKQPEEYDPKPAHAQLALKMRRRDATSAPRMGDRVPYILTAPEDKKSKVSESAEDPGYFLEHDAPLHVVHYLDMLRKAVERVFERVYPGITARIFDGSELPAVGKRRSTVRIDALFSGAIKMGGGALAPEHVALQDPPSLRIHPNQKRKMEGMAVSAATPENVGTITGKKNEKKDRIASDNPASNATLAWAKQKSRIVVDEVEKRLRAVVASKRGLSDEEVSRGMANRIMYVHRTSTASPIVALGMVRMSERCLSCGGPVPENRPRRVDAPCACEESREACDCEEKKGSPAICVDCIVSKPNIRQKMLASVKKELSEMKQENDSLWSTCLKCVGTTIEDAEVCSYKECSTWFPRNRTRMELGRITCKSRRFDYYP